MLIRAFWKIPDDWTPREIEGRLTVSYPDGTEPSSSSRSRWSRARVRRQPRPQLLLGPHGRRGRPRHHLPRRAVGDSSPAQEELPEPATPPRLPVDGATPTSASRTATRSSRSPSSRSTTTTAWAATPRPTLRGDDAAVPGSDVHDEPGRHLEFTMHEPDRLERAAERLQRAQRVHERPARRRGRRARALLLRLRRRVQRRPRRRRRQGLRHPAGRPEEDAWQRVSSGLSTGDTVGRARPSSTRSATARAAST
jgi:hypothetical protein